MFYIWKCQESPNYPHHFVATAEENLNPVPNQQCITCGGALKLFKKIPDDGNPRVGFDAELVRNDISKKGYCAFEVTITQVTS